MAGERSQPPVVPAAENTGDKDETAPPTPEPVFLVSRRRTRPEPANAIFEYLEIFPNRQRRHSAIGWLGTPIAMTSGASSG